MYHHVADSSTSRQGRRTPFPTDTKAHEAANPFPSPEIVQKSHTAATRKRLHHNRDHHQLQTRAGVYFSNSNVANYK
jgi:hypothetical protein